MADPDKPGRVMKDIIHVLLATGLILYTLIALLSLDRTRENQHPSFNGEVSDVRLLVALHR
jgi:hypothetical protein